MLSAIPTVSWRSVRRRRGEMARVATIASGASTTRTQTSLSARPTASWAELRAPSS